MDAFAGGPAALPVKLRLCTAEGARGAHASPGAATRLTPRGQDWRHNGTATRFAALTAKGVCTANETSRRDVTPRRAACQDCNMPIMDGWQVRRRARARAPVRSRAPDAPVRAGVDADAAMAMAAGRGRAAAIAIHAPSQNWEWARVSASVRAEEGVRVLVGLESGACARVHVRACVRARA